MKNFLGCLVASASVVGIGAVPHPIRNLLPSEATTNTTHLGSRNPDPRGPFCNIPGKDPALQDDIRNLIWLLHQETAQTCVAPAGPGGCTRVACQTGASIWMCNDNTTPSQAPYSMIGDYAQTILDRCGYEESGQKYVVQDQLFDVGDGPNGSGGWGNVVVELDLDCDFSVEEEKKTVA